MLVPRVAFILYCSLLTFGLLHPDPLSVFGIESLPGPGTDRGVHFLAFLGLALLTRAAHWPVRDGLLIGLLTVYAILIETLQLCVPERSVEALDYLENFLGLAVGLGLWRFLQRRLG